MQTHIECEKEFLPEYPSIDTQTLTIFPVWLRGDTGDLYLTIMVELYGAILLLLFAWDAQTLQYFSSVRGLVISIPCHLEGMLISYLDITSPIYKAQPI